MERNIDDVLLERETRVGDRDRRVPVAQPAEGAHRRHQQSEQQTKDKTRQRVLQGAASGPPLYVSHHPEEGKPGARRQARSKKQARLPGASRAASPLPLPGSHGDDNGLIGRSRIARLRGRFALVPGGTKLCSSTALVFPRLPSQAQLSCRFPPWRKQMRRRLPRRTPRPPLRSTNLRRRRRRANAPAFCGMPRLA